jgi:hypothetical protein
MKYVGTDALSATGGEGWGEVESFAFVSHDTFAFLPATTSL